MTTGIETTGMETGLLAERPRERRHGGDRPYVMPQRLLRLLAPLLALAPQFSRYVVVSVLALGLDFSVFLLLTHTAGVKASLAGVTGYGMGLALHFVLSTRFVFERRGLDKSQRRLLAEFALSGLVGVVLTWSIIALVVDVAGFYPVVGKVLAVGLSFVAVYLLRRSIVFAGPREVTSPDP